MPKENGRHKRRTGICKQKPNIQEEHKKEFGNNRQIVRKASEHNFKIM